MQIVVVGKGFSPFRERTVRADNVKSGAVTLALLPQSLGEVMTYRLKSSAGKVSDDDLINGIIESYRLGARRAAKLGGLAICLSMGVHTVFSQSVSEWRVSLALESGGGCFSTANGIIRIKDDVMSFYITDFSVNDEILRWRITLAADGSADGQAETFNLRSAKPARTPSRVTVPVGIGPRIIRSVGGGYACRYRYLPQ